jgi:mono/diheme cytochrome c family protein
MIRFACPNCMHVYDVHDRQAGTKFACESCGQRVQVPKPVQLPTVLASAEPTADGTSSPSSAPTWILVICGIAAATGSVLLVLAPTHRGQPTLPSSPPAPTASRPAEVDEKAIARRAREVLASNCYRCHGQNGAAEGGFNYILDRDRLVARRKVVPYKPGNSKLFGRVQKGEMPPPEEGIRVRPEEVAILRRWIEVGAPSAADAPPSENHFIDNPRLVSLIHADLLTLPERDRRFTRYFTITHLANAGLSKDELQTYRLALAKLVNSLSWNKEIKHPLSVDEARTVLRLDIRDYSWNERLWSRLLAAYPYRLLPDTAEARALLEAAAGQLSFVRGDWFVAAASRPPLYHDLLQLPQQERTLEEQLHISLREDIRQERVARAAFNGSGVSRNNRLLERHASPYGAYWRSYDFSSNLGRRNLFEHPLGPGPDPDFEHDGGEVIFNLPNGLHAFLLVDGRGRRIDKAPVGIVSDPRRPDRAVETAVSCMTCHSRGLIPKADQVRPHVERNPAAFSVTEAETVRALYPPEGSMRALFAADNERFRKAVEQTGGRLATTEPVAALVQQYEKELDLTAASAELGLQPDDLLRRLKRSAELARRLGPLAIPGGTVQRQVFDDAFPDAVRDFRLGSYLSANVDDH